jgi:hypothetical protein
MKKCVFLFLSLILLTSCSTVNVVVDYDSQADFNQYKTFAFYKSGIDKANVSDIDKKRILRAIEGELLAKGFKKSDKPDILVSIFTKSREKVNVNLNNNNFVDFYGFGRNPYMYGYNNGVNISQYAEGTLFIDFIDKQKKELVWQGIGTGALRNLNREKKEIRIKEFVKEIISKFPPEQEK